MLLAKRKISLTIALLTASLAGLVIVQAYLLRSAFDLKERVFRGGVQAALFSVPRKLEATEAAAHVRRRFSWTGPDSVAAACASALGSTPPGQSAPGDSARIGPIAARAILLRHDVAAEAGSAKRELVERIMVDLLAVNREPIVERFGIARIDSAVGISLREAGIGLEYAAGLVRVAEDTLIAVSDERYRAELQRSDLRASLIPLEFAPPFHQVVVHFPRGRAHLWLQIWPLLAAALVLTLIVVYCFAQAIRTIAEQQRFATQIVDFVNNMTHEFKTPISTIALASEAIARREVEANLATVQRYNRMIGDENRRMRAQVEKILQVAQLERGDFRLALEELDLHVVISRAMEGFALQIERRRGTIAHDFAATRSLVRGDRVHLTGIIDNLLDNAAKYSPGPPEISVGTHNDNDWVVVTISDRGEGIDATHLGRVFEKYFRCPTGERHDVKGFGLGLSYVKLLTEAHRGRVDLDSRLGEGTRVTLRLPLAGTGAALES